MIPPINWKAKKWHQLVDAKYFCVEPPLTKDFCVEELVSFTDSDKSMERSVKLVSEASHICYGFDGRHKAKTAKITSRKMRPMFASKGGYFQNYDTLIL